MRNVGNQIYALGCLRRASSEENEMLHRNFKELYSSRNKHVQSLEPQLTPSEVQWPELYPATVQSRSDVDNLTTVIQASITKLSTWAALISSVVTSL